jgi:hypothetical protein
MLSVVLKNIGGSNVLAPNAHDNKGYENNTASFMNV